MHTRTKIDNIIYFAEIILYNIQYDIKVILHTIYIKLFKNNVDNWKTL